jgi:hypothetical protein
MYKQLYQTESNINDLKSQAKKALKSAREEESNYTSVKIYMLNGKSISIYRIAKNTYSVLIRNRLGNKIDEFNFNDLESENFDFIN